MSPMFRHEDDDQQADGKQARAEQWRRGTRPRRGRGGARLPVSASARRLPFAAGTFDGVAHTDVLC